MIVVDTTGWIDYFNGIKFNKKLILNFQVINPEYL